MWTAYLLSGIIAAMIYNSIEEELWRIFTFYALHSDPTQPEVLKPANFIKFCKDCQITSKKFTTSSVELEIARLVSCGCVLIYFTCTSLCRFFRNVGTNEVPRCGLHPVQCNQLHRLHAAAGNGLGEGKKRWKKVAYFSFYLQLHHAPDLTRFEYNTTS